MILRLTRAAMPGNLSSRRATWNFLSRPDDLSLKRDSQQSGCPEQFSQIVFKEGANTKAGPTLLSAYRGLRACGLGFRV